MIEQLTDSGFTGGGAGDGSVAFNEKKLPLPVVVKKRPLRDLPNENNVIITKSIGDSTLPKERIPVKVQVSGTKRSSSEVSPPSSQAANAINANENLVYVRRKTEAEVGKISSSGTAGSGTDLQLSVKAPVLEEKDQPSSVLNNPQIDASNISHSLESSLNSPAVPINMRNETPLLDSHKSGTIMPSSEDTSLLPHPAGKSGNTVSSSENKSPLRHPVGISVNTMSSVENKSPHPHPVGMSVNSTSSTKNKYPLLPLGKSGNTTSATDNKSAAPHPLGSSDGTASMEIRSLIPRPVGTGNSVVLNSSVEKRSPIPCHGKSGNVMSSVEINHIPLTSVTTKLDFTKESNSKHLQHWHVRPRVSLNGFDRSAHEEYWKMLHSLSSVELSQLAFELETRSIQLSLEEAREIARVEMLNVMGKSSKPSKSPVTLSEK